MSVGLAIFVKTPGYSPVKTRLAADCGRARAEDWYRRAAAAVVSVARITAAEHDIEPYWAVAETDAIANGAWPDLPVLDQGEGGLGERMARVHANLVAKHGAGVLIGADTPQLSADLLGAAIAWLQQPGPRLCLGPARDGGFWLFGGNVAPPTDSWQRVRYSARETARDLRRTMRNCGQWQTLQELSDVDHASDLAEVHDALLRLPEASPEQQQLLASMRSSFQWLATRPAERERGAIASHGSMSPGSRLRGNDDVNDPRSP